MSKGKPKPKQLANGRWQGRITWNDPTTGARRQLTKTFVHRADCVEWLDMVYRRRAMNTLHEYYLELQRAHLTVHKMLDSYFASRSFTTLDPVTRRNYKSYAERWIIPAFGDSAAASLDAGVIKKWVASLLDQNYSASALRQAKSPFSMAYEEAIDSRLLHHNPVRPVKIEPRRHARMAGKDDKAPSRTSAGSGDEFKGDNPPEASLVDSSKLEPDARAFTEKELPLLYKGIEGSRERVLLHLLLGTGLRPSEGVALMWGDVDFKAKKLHVMRAGEEDGTIGPCKSESGQRVITISDYLVSMLKEWKPKGAKKNDLIFPSRWGNLKRVSNLGDAFKLLLRKVGLDEDHSLYDLRHTHASLMWQATRDVKAISNRLGHSSEAFTLKQYIWMREADDEACADAMQAFANVARRVAKE